MRPIPYPPPLFRAVDAWNVARSGLQMVHLAESQAEIDFLARGNGFFEGLLKRRGRWVPDFQPPGAGAAAYLEGLGFLGPRTLTVHGTQLTAADCDLLAGTKTWLVLCPRANRYTGAGAPPVPDLLKAGVNLCPGHRLPGGQLGPESLWGDALALPELSRLARGPLAAPGDPERRPGPGPGPGIRQPRPPGKRRPWASSPYREAGISGVNSLPTGRPGSGAGWDDSPGSEALGAGFKPAPTEARIGPF